jgi:putative FmdB family regulatory protein
VPIYEYVCQSCAHRFEVRQKFSDAPMTSCGRCGQAVSKIISAPAIMFKGSGWYVTDYSDKLKAPGQNESAEKPNGQAEKPDQKPAVSSGDTATAAPASTPATSGSDAGGGAKPATTNSTPSSSSSSSGSSGNSTG